MPRSNVSIARGDSATDPSSEYPPPQGLGAADTDTPSITIDRSRGDSVVSPINNGETDLPHVREASNPHDIRSETGDSSEEESPIRNIKG